VLKINHCSRHQSKGAPGIAAIAVPAEPFLTAPAQKMGGSRGRGLRNRARYGQSLNPSGFLADFFREEQK
jgi:hypothetical protein